LSIELLTTYSQSSEKLSENNLDSEK
jgi:hypothetical protein